MSDFTCICFVLYVIDVIDVVKDQLHGTDYAREEDPRIYVSQKTGRGPLSENWIEEYWEECKVPLLPTILLLFNELFSSLLLRLSFSSSLHTTLYTLHSAH